MSGEPLRQGLLDTNILILRSWIDPAELPEEMAISAITLAELSAGPYEVRSNDEQDMYDEHAERARRLEILQRAESEFDPVRFDTEAHWRSRRNEQGLRSGASRRARSETPEGSATALATANVSRARLIIRRLLPSTWRISPRAET